MNKTKIEYLYTDGKRGFTWNPTSGCEQISSGCANCWAKRTSRRFKGLYGYPADNPFRPVCHDNRLHEPTKLKTPAKIAVSFMGDLFHDEIPFSFHDEIFEIMTGSANQHTYFILTKRPERMKEYLKRWVVLGQSLNNIWFGVSIEDQETAHKRIDQLIQIMSLNKFISYAPALGPVDISEYLKFSFSACVGFDSMGFGIYEETKCIKWVVAEGESGPGARPCHPDWIRSIQKQCEESETPFMFKQCGEWALKGSVKDKASDFGVLTPDGTWYHQHTGWNGRDIDPDTREAYMVKVGKKAAGRLLDGQEYMELPK